MHCCQLQAVVVGGRLWTVTQSQACDQIGFAVGPGDLSLLEDYYLAILCVLQFPDGECIAK